MREAKLLKRLKAVLVASQEVADCGAILAHPEGIGRMRKALKKLPDDWLAALAPPPEAPLREAGNCTTCDGHGTVFGEWCECERYCPDCDGTTKESPDA